MVAHRYPFTIHVKETQPPSELAIYGPKENSWGYMGRIGLVNLGCPYRSSKEWLEMKKAIKDTVSLSPLNTNLPVHLHVDASKLNGIGYILTQPRTNDPKDGYNIIDVGSTCFTETQRRYSTVETEALGVSWALGKVNYYVRAAEIIQVYTDCKSLQSLFVSSPQNTTT